MSIIRNKPYIRRIPLQLNYQKGITTYDADNLYPQRIDEIMFRSPITESAIDRLADFIYGDGFSENGDLIVNGNELTANDVLRQISYDAAKFKSAFSLHVNWNLLGEIVDFSPIEFKFIRYGLPDENGRHSDVKVNINWDSSPGIFPHNISNTIYEYPLFDPLFETNDLSDADFEGQVLYQVPIKDVYPRCTFDSVIDSSQTNGEIQVFELGNIQNGFLSSSFIKYPGEFEDDDAKRAFMNDLAAMKGPGNTNSMQLIEMKNMEEFPNIIEQFPSNNNDKLFDLTNTNVTNRIIQAIAVPPTLLGIFPSSGIFNQEDYENSYIWMNHRTRNIRRVIERVFNNKIGKLWNQGEINFGEIIEKQYDVGNKVNNEG